MVSVATVSLVAASAVAGRPAQARNNRVHVESANDRVLLLVCPKRTLAMGSLFACLITNSTQLLEPEFYTILFPSLIVACASPAGQDSCRPKPEP